MRMQKLISFWPVAKSMISDSCSCLTTIMNVTSISLRYYIVNSVSNSIISSIK